jgi:hypothetical protein
LIVDWYTDLRYALACWVFKFLFIFDRVTDHRKFHQTHLIILTVFNHIFWIHLLLCNYNLWDCFSEIIDSILSNLHIVLLNHVNILRIVCILLYLRLIGGDARVLLSSELIECFDCLVETILCFLIFLGSKLQNYVPCLLIFREFLYQIIDWYWINYGLTWVTRRTACMLSLIDCIFLSKHVAFACNHYALVSTKLLCF